MTVTNYDGRLEQMAVYCETMLYSLAKLNNAFQDVNNDSYSISFPGDMISFKDVKKIGGKTICMNQYFDYEGIESTTTNNVTMTNNEDGSFSFVTGEGGASAYASFFNFNYRFPVGHKVLMVCPDGASSTTYHWYHTNLGTTVSSTSIKTVTSAWNSGTWRFRVTTGTEMDITFTPQWIDLTQLFGAGNEPTLEQCQQMFPAPYYAFNKGSLLSAGVTSVVSKKADTTTIATYPIPAEIQALEGYGWSAGTAYNYVDFENKKFVQNVGSVDLSTLTWGYGPSVGWSATLNAKNPADDDTVLNGISATLTPVTRNAQATAFSGGTDAGMVSVSGGKVYVGTGSIIIVPSGTLIYELDEPVETDISAYLTDTDIEVEAGGTLTFENQHGDDFRIPVPSEVEYVGLS